MKGIMEMMVDVGRAADHFGRAIWKRTRTGRTAKRISELKPLKVGTLLRDTYKVEKLLFWDGRCNRYLVTSIEDKGVYELREFLSDHGIEVEREIIKKRLQHRGLVRRQDFFVEDAGSYVVLDYERAPNLEDTRTTLSDRDLLSIAFNLVDTLDFLHRHWIAHVDLSTRNIRDMGETQKIVDLSGCRLFRPPSTEGFRESRKRDFLELLDLLERLILRSMEESEDPSLLPFIKGFEELVFTPPVSAEDFREGLFQCNIMEAARRDDGVRCGGIPQDEKIRSALASDGLRRYIGAC
jgi:serine/threonine protein kinase